MFSPVIDSTTYAGRWAISSSGAEFSTQRRRERRGTQRNETEDSRSKIAFRNLSVTEKLSNNRRKTFKRSFSFLPPRSSALSASLRQGFCLETWLRRRRAGQRCHNPLG